MKHRRILEQAFRRHGIIDPALQSYINCCDLTCPVVQLDLVPGDILDTWVRDEGTPGRFGAPQGEDPAKLAITIEGRHLEQYVVRRSFNAISCTAAAFAKGLVDKVGGDGGGTQYILPPGWLKAVERIL